jgi:hypothetical protein
MAFRVVSGWGVALGAGLILLLAPPAQDRMAELRQQFESETDPVRKAKALTRLGDAQWEAARKASAADNHAEARLLVLQYLDDTETAANALKASGINAEKKPRGFKELQIHVRKSLRELDQMILSVPAEERGSLEVYRRDLRDIEKQLINVLFPRQPGKEAPKG